MAEQEKHIELRSEDVSEILGTPPAWLVRWGTTVILLCFALLLWVGWTIRYPDVVGAKVVFTTTMPPVEVVARVEGHIAELLAEENANVSRGDVLVVLQSTANHQDILLLDSLIGVWQKASPDQLRAVSPPSVLELGDVQNDYAAFVQNIESFKFGRQDRRNAVSSSVGAIGQQIAQLNKSIVSDENALKRAQKQLDEARRSYDTQRQLHQQGLISNLELERERNRVSDAERQVDQAADNISDKRRQIAALQRNAGETNFGAREADAGNAVRLRESLNTLRSSLDRWKQNYLLVSPIDGKVAFNANYFSARQYVKQGDPVMTIVPPTNDQIVGRMLLPVTGSGKVQAGQRVVIKLDGYPYYEFGSIEGSVRSKSAVPKDDQYAILITLKDGLKTNFNRTIPFEQQLQGWADVVIEDKRFLQRIVDQLFARSR